MTELWFMVYVDEPIKLDYIFCICLKFLVLAWFIYSGFWSWSLISLLCSCLCLWCVSSRKVETQACWFPLFLLCFGRIDFVVGSVQILQSKSLSKYKIDLLDDWWLSYEFEALGLNRLVKVNLNFLCLTRRGNMC